MDTPYEVQLQNKARLLNELLADFYNNAIEVMPSPQTQYHRNKMEFAFSNQIDKSKTVKDGPKYFEQKLGMRENRRWDRAFNLNNCYLFSPDTGKLLQSVRQWAKDNNVSYYDSRSKKGTLRLLMVREAKNTGQKMVALQTFDNNYNAGSFKEAVLKVWPDAEILTLVNNGLSDVAPEGAQYTVINGSGHIFEELKLTDKTIKFKISPKSFFQTNTKAAEKLYNAVRTEIKKLKPETVYDLYGGSGGLSFACSDIAQKCISVEMVKEAVEDGKTNIKLNNANNIEFYSAKTEDFITQGVINPNNSVVLLDPPRAGVHEKALKQILAAEPKNIIYVSCNPKSLANDLRLLTEKYRAVNITGYDLFPHTEHVETLAVLTLKQANK